MEPNSENPLDAYHSSNYYSTCPRESPVLSSWPYVVYPLQYTNIVFLPLSILAGYAVLFKTPKQMLSMKWVYLNVHFWVSFQSISVSLLITPICWLPTISTSMLGFLSYLGVPHVEQAYLAMSVMTLSMSSIISLFENRHQMISQNKWRIRNPWIRYTLLGFNYLYSIVYSLPIFLEVPDQFAAKMAVLTHIKCPYEDFFTIPVFTASTTSESRQYIAISMIVCMSAMMAQLNFYSSTCLHYLVFSRSTSTSKVTSDRQKKFFVGILMQVGIPYVFMTPAFSYSVYSIFTGYYSQKANNSVMLIFNCYGAVATLALLLSHSPYRAFLKTLLRIPEEITMSGKSSGNRISLVGSLKTV